MNSKCKLIFILFLLLDVKIRAQESHGGIPLTFSQEYEKLFHQNNLRASTPQYQMPYVDNDAEILKVKGLGSNCDQCKSGNYYAKIIDVNIDLLKESEVIDLKNGDKIYRYLIKSQNAIGMQFYFDKFKIPSGGKLFFYNSDRKMLLGSFTEKNNSFDKNSLLPFGTEPIYGKEIYIEYFEPVNSEFNTDLNIKTVAHLFRDIDKSGPFHFGVGAGNCHINVSCPQGDNWNDEIRSVAIILVYNIALQYMGWCSGAVMNNTAYNGMPYFLTANHCAVGSTPEHNFGQWLFLFNHIDPDCSGDGSTVSNVPFSSVYGSELVSRDNPTGSVDSDWLLLKLFTNVQTLALYNACFAGWDKGNSGGALTNNTTCIHHPMGDVKKISFDYDAPLSISLLSGIDNYWQVQWDMQGVTEHGSSGSPLFNDDHKVIGQLKGGPSSCTNQTGTDDYGKFSNSWIASGSAFANALDGINLGLTTTYTYCPSNIETCNNRILDPGELGVDCGGICPQICGTFGPPHVTKCNNGIRDGNETGIDCGGDCGACTQGQITGLGRGLGIDADDASCDKHYETFADPNCVVDVSTFNIYDPSTFTRAFLSSPQCIDGEWNALQGRPALVPGYSNVGMYLWGHTSGCGPAVDPTGGNDNYCEHYGSSAYFTTSNKFFQNRDYTVSFYAKAVSTIWGIQYSKMTFYLAHGLVPYTNASQDLPIYIKNLQGNEYQARFGTGANTFDLFLLGEYNYGFEENWDYHKFTFNPPNDYYYQLLVVVDYLAATPIDDIAGRVFIDNLAVCSECDPNGTNDIAFDGVTLSGQTSVNNSISAINSSVPPFFTTKFFAGNNIQLGDNFQVSTNGWFEARIVSCDPNSELVAHQNGNAILKSTFASLDNGYKNFELKPYRKNLSKEFIPLPKNVDPSTIHVAVRESNSPININNITISPNPMVNELQVSFKTQDNSKVSMAIFDMYGNFVLNLMENREYTSGLQIISSNFKNLSSGVYFLIFTDNGSSETKKIIKL